ncbi:hypothetical protein BH10BAC6_BH10BAC6_05220 [soil metagenome]
MRVALLLVVLVVCVSARAGTDSTGRSTVVVLDEHLRRCLSEITKSIRAGESVHVVVATHPDSLWIQATASQSVQERGGVLVAESGGTETSELTITPVDVSTSYANTESADTVIRTITTSLRGTLDTPQRGISSVPCSSKIDEKISREQAERLQSDQHHATRSMLPPRPTTLWQDILEPAIFVGAAVITAVLLFTVRSQ